MPVLVRDLKEKYANRETTIVSPDGGGVVRARAYAKRMDAPLAIIDKRRERAGVSEVMHLVGEVEGTDCILVDDIVDSAGTLCNAAKALKDAGAKSVSAYVAHGVLSGPALERIENSVMDEVVITDSIKPTEGVRENSKIRVVTVAPLLAEAMNRIAHETSVSSLFD
jgi:ribose-phosphate pyrophosphokinase